MFNVSREHGLTCFAIRPEESTVGVSLAGDFTDWRLTPMQKQDNDAFTTSFVLPRGTYSYKFIVDGRWITDPDNCKYAICPIGTVNSVAHVS